jgi:hypothetical protein
MRVDAIRKKRLQFEPDALTSGVHRASEMTAVDDEADGARVSNEAPSGE